MMYVDYEHRTLSAITTLKCQLVDFIEPDIGLLDELLRLEVLSQAEYEDIRSERRMYDRNDALFDVLTTEGQCVKFLTALQNTHQQHVLNFVTQNGGQRSNHCYRNLYSPNIER